MHLLIISKGNTMHHDRINTYNVVDATVNDHCSFLDPLSFYHLCFSDTNNQDVCSTHLDRNREG